MKKTKQVRQARQAKVKVWNNGMGAYVGRSEVIFTGIETGDKKLKEAVYVTLKYPVWHCPLLYIKNKSADSLRTAVAQARAIKNSKLYD